MDSSRLFQLSVEITVVWPMLSLHHLFIAHGCLMITVKLSQWLSYAVSRITSIHVFTADDHLRAGRKPGRYSVLKPRRNRRCIFPVLHSTTQTQPPTVKDNNGSYLLRGMKASVFLRGLSNRILLVIWKCRHYFWTFTGSRRLTLILLFVAGP